MLTELCQELKNWFDRGMPKYYGTFKIEGGQLTDCSYLQDGQYFRIIGSVFNDGVHKYEPAGATSLVDEVFDGSVWAMAVPPTVVALAEKIAEWRAEYEGVGSTAMSPFQSESFGGYSYAKGGGGGTASGNRGNGSPSWQSMFASELNKWRKI